MIDVLIIIAILLLMALPLLVGCITFHLNKANKQSHKRTLMMTVTLVYLFVAFLTMVVAQALFDAIANIQFVKWLIGYFPDQNGLQTALIIASLVNIAIGVGFVLVNPLSSLCMKRLKTETQRIEQSKGFVRLHEKAISVFKKKHWGVCATVLKPLNWILTVFYALVWIVFFVSCYIQQIPQDVLGLIEAVFKAGNVYPVFTLIGLWEAYYFLAGIQRLDLECPEWSKSEQEKKQGIPFDLEAVDKAVKEEFRDYYACDVNVTAGLSKDDGVKEHEQITKLIASSVEMDKRNPQKPREAYLNCLDGLLVGKNGILINGSFFSEFSAYFLRYVTMMLARGDSAVFICNSDAQIDKVYDYVVQGISEITSIYSEEAKKQGISYDSPIWKVVKVSGEHDSKGAREVEKCDILVTTLAFLCSDRFERDHSDFISLIDAVVFVDSLKTVNTYNRQLAILNTHLKHLARLNSIRARNAGQNELSDGRLASRQIQYVCFDDTRAPGLDRVLTNMLGISFDTVDAMCYNPQTVVRCYSYEGRKNEDGRIVVPNFINTNEEVGAVMSMALWCLSKGASNVTVFAEDNIPYANYIETIMSHRSQITVNANPDCIRLNKVFYNPDSYSVVIAMDSGDNLPAVLRKCASMVSDSPALILVFSRSYMLRDYYKSNIDGEWVSAQIERIPVEIGTRKEVAQKILVKANAGGITKQDLMNLAGGEVSFAKFVEQDDVDAILRAVLDIYGIDHEEVIDLNRHFVYASSKNFDENGKFNSIETVILKKTSELAVKLNGRDMIRLVDGTNVMQLPLPHSRLTQNYIEGQNLLHNGKIYAIQRIDVKNGIVYAKLATSGKNDDAYEYVQSREYRVDLNPDLIEDAFQPKHAILHKSEQEIKVNEAIVSAFRAPMEVLTDGYYVLDPHTLSRCETGRLDFYKIDDEGHSRRAMQVYRRYGQFDAEKSAYRDEIYKEFSDWTASAKGALMMSVCLKGEFGETAERIANLASVMMGEVLRSMFPSVADSVRVCPIVSGVYEGEEKTVLSAQSKLSVLNGEGGCNENQLQWLIIEDCAADLGVVSALMSAGGSILKTLFEPLYRYLSWYGQSEKSEQYLYFGLDHEPQCFDFSALYKLSKAVGDDYHDLDFKDYRKIATGVGCDFCGRRVKDKNEVIKLRDGGRMMCRGCKDSILKDARKNVEGYIGEIRAFLLQKYAVRIDDVAFSAVCESYEKIEQDIKSNIANRKLNHSILKSYLDKENQAHIEKDVPPISLKEMLVCEMTRVWQIKNLPDLEGDIAEGLTVKVSLDYIEYVGAADLYEKRKRFYESSRGGSGTAYRKLIGLLENNREYGSNPFRYLQEKYGNGFKNKTGEFYFSRLNTEEQELYRSLLHSICQYETKFEPNGADLNKVNYAICYDHPEIFWYRGRIKDGELIFTETEKASEEIKCKIERALPSYVAGITDQMSDYEKAFHLHKKLIDEVEYDFDELKRQKEKPLWDTETDPIRTIYGPFINKKAVCEGYARALQYLLQRCGIECAEVAGNTVKGGEGHAWNVVKLDGEYYYIDTTWDDHGRTEQNRGEYDYFCITTEELLRTRDTSISPVELPICESVKANYYVREGLYLELCDKKSLADVLKNAKSKKSEQGYVTVKCATKEVYDSLVGVLDAYAGGADAQAKDEKLCGLLKKNGVESFALNYEATQIYTVTFKLN